MTIAIVLKIGDGLVFGADSASTLSNGATFVNSYFNAEKVFNVVKGLPLGAVTAGLGGLAGRSVMSLAKDLRQKLCDPAQQEWFLDPDSYTPEDAAQRIKRFFFDDLYQKQFAALDPDLPRPAMFFLLGGYGAHQTHSEIWRVSVDQRGYSSVTCDGTRESPWGISWQGMPEALNRIVRGYSSGVYNGLIKTGIPEPEVQRFLGGIEVEALIHDAMPLQDAIDLVHYLIEVTTGFVRFAPGVPMVHPPIDSAAITLHEGYRWIRRKHYFSRKLNRPIERYDVNRRTRQ
jgi:hypothetical protein